MISRSKLALVGAAATIGLIPFAAGAQSGGDREPAGGAFMSSYARPPSGGFDRSGSGLLTSTERRPYGPDLTTGSIPPARQRADAPRRAR